MGKQTIIICRGKISFICKYSQKLFKHIQTTEENYCLSVKYRILHYMFENAKSKWCTTGFRCSDKMYSFLDGDNR